ncbi:MAG: helix-turn-helix domain-containing protein [Bacteriovoracaceae bacterium]|nr:helix-turn-helix domain-containing protein [Bacteriovoracaceae bacterium]
MPKRSRIKKVTKESKALKAMREAKGLSQRTAANLVGVPSTTINHTENGRAYIKEEYVRKFINGLGYSWTDWNNYLEGKEIQTDLRSACITIIENMDKQKLGVIYNLLTNF